MDYYFYILMTQSPKISILIPSFNRAELLDKALNSVLRQPYENLELIVIDSNSQDNSRTIMAELKENGDSAILVSGHSVPPFDYPYYQTNRSVIVRAYSRFRSEVDGSDGFVDQSQTKKALRFLEKEKPDLIHLHAKNQDIGMVDNLLSLLRILRIGKAMSFFF